MNKKSEEELRLEELEEEKLIESWLNDTEKTIVKALTDDGMSIGGARWNVLSGFYIPCKNCSIIADAIKLIKSRQVSDPKIIKEKFYEDCFIPWPDGNGYK